MYTPDVLLDIHSRAQRSLQRLLESCRTLSGEELQRGHNSFGYASVSEQLEHIIGSADYWMLIFEGEYKDDPAPAEAAKAGIEGDGDGQGESADASAGRRRDIDALEAWRAEIDALSRELIAAQTPEWLSTAREFYCWPGKWSSMVPAHIVLRIATHCYHHQGQVLAMCRAMGHVFEEGFDFPLD